jgi:hypothetical protein
MTSKLIRWKSSGDGYWKSIDGRFEISPAGFRGNTTPDGYDLDDNKDLGAGSRARRFDRIREAKSFAEQILFGESFKAEK